MTIMLAQPSSESGGEASSASVTSQADLSVILNPTLSNTSKAAAAAAVPNSTPPSIINPVSSPPRRIPGLNFLPTSSPMRQRQLDDLVRSSGASVDSPPRKLSAGISSSGSGAPSPRRRPRRGRGKKGEEESASADQEKQQNKPQKEQRRRQLPQHQQDEPKAVITRYFPASPSHFVKDTSLNNNNDDCEKAEAEGIVSKTRTPSSTDGIAIKGITHLGNGDSATSQQQKAQEQQQPQQPAPTPGKKKKRRRKKTAASSATLETVTACPHRHGLLSPPGIKTGGKRGGGRAAQSSTNEDENQPRQSHLTDFYQVRRSDRRPKSEKEKEEKEMIVTRIKDGSTHGLRVDEMPMKGRGVVADKNFVRGEFVIEYDGDLISFDKAKKRECEYLLNPAVGCYMYFFTFQNRKYCVDATSESGKLGRLINHSTKTPNLTTRLFPIGDRPHLIFVAARDIDAGEELMYDYGDRSREATEAHPWLKS